MTIPTPKSTRVTLAGIEWDERYNCYVAIVAGWLNLAFSWTKDGYKITVAGVALKNCHQDRETAARIAVASALVLIGKAKEELAK
jgi:hypothetical protein